MKEIFVRIDLESLSNRKPITTILETYYMVYDSGYRGLFKTFMNLVKAFYGLLHGNTMKRLSNTVKKWKDNFEK